MKVFIIESSDPEDFYLERSDGAATRQLLKLLGINVELRIALDMEHFRKSVRESRKKFDVLHIACHGDHDGIAISTGEAIEWSEFSEMFQGGRTCPNALVMSSCCSATSGLSDAFTQVSLRPQIIFGSTDKRYYQEYAVAWSILYQKFLSGRVDRDTAQEALRAICAVVHRNFRYMRWDDATGRYRNFPKRKMRYVVREEPSAR